MEELKQALSRFSPIGLDQMDKVQLLDRIDTKYIINQEKLSAFLASLADSYKVLCIDGQVFHPYETLYFDTPEFDLYKMHHNGRQNRYKLRFRKYVNSGISFFEVKLKTNTHRTVKKRVSVSRIEDNLSENQQQFVHECTRDDYNDYVPSLRVRFNRITLVNLLAGERLTIDINLNYGFHDTRKDINNIAIVEVKQEKHSVSPFRQLMHDNRQREFYLSKYCLGITCLYDNLKKNRFKKKLMALNKLGYDVC